MFRRMVVVFAFQAAFVTTIAMAAPPAASTQPPAAGGLPAATPAGLPAATPAGLPAATPTGLPAATPAGLAASAPNGPTGSAAMPAVSTGRKPSPRSAADKKDDQSALTLRAIHIAAMREAVGAPARARLGDVAVDRLVDGEFYIPGQAAKRLLIATGHPVPADFIGLLIGKNGLRDYAAVGYVPAGHIDADTALHWNAADYLSCVSDKVKQENKAMAAQHLEPLEARRWIWPPHYDRTRHQLRWAALIVPAGSPPESGGLVTYHALAFGHTGYIAVSVRASDTKAPRVETMLRSFMANLRFLPGQRYADATASDPRAPGGLAAAMGLASLHKAPVHFDVLTSRIFIPVAGGVVALVGLVAGALLSYRAFKRRARRI